LEKEKLIDTASVWIKLILSLSKTVYANKWPLPEKVGGI